MASTPTTNPDPIRTMVSLLRLGAALCWYTCPPPDHSSGSPDCGNIRGRCCSPMMNNCRFYYACDFGVPSIQECYGLDRFDPDSLTCNPGAVSTCFLPDEGEEVPTPTLPTTVVDEKDEEVEDEDVEIVETEEEFLESVYTTYVRRRKYHKRS